MTPPAPSLHDLPFATQSRESVVSLQPFTVRRVARWSECDPAGVVYTGNFAEYLLSAAYLFRLHLFGSWDEIRQAMHVDLPAKAVSLVFSGSLWPDNVFDTAVHVGQIRTRTFDILAGAVRHGSGEQVFQGRLTSICIAAADRNASQPLPRALRDRLQVEADLSPAPAHLQS